MGDSERPDTTMRFGVFEVDPRSGDLRRSGTRIRLQDQPFKVLIALLEHPGEVVTREELQVRIWPQESFGDFDHAVNVAVAKLRAALGDSAEVPRYVETLHRRGYRFIFPLAGTGGPNPGVATTQESIRSTIAPALNASAQPIPSKLRSWTRLSAVLVVGLLGAATFAFWTYRRLAQPTRMNSPEMEITKVTNKGNVDSVAISPDGRYLVYAFPDKERLGLWTREIGTQSEVQILRSEEPLVINGLTFSPDGTHVYFSRIVNESARHSHLYRLPVLGGTPQLLIKDVDSPVGFSPDGGRFVFVRKDLKRNAAEVRLANADGTGERLLTTVNEAGSVWSQSGGSWSPDGQTIAVSVAFWPGKPGSELATISVADGSVHALYTSQDTYEMGRPLWLPEGDALVVVLYDNKVGGRLWTISYPAGEAKPLTHDFENYDPLINMTRDGKTIAANASAMAFNIYVLQATDFSRAQQLTFGRHFVNSVTVGPDGRLLVHELLNPQGELWKMSADGSQRVLFSSLRNIGIFTIRCGTFVLFVAAPKGTQELIRVDADGLNPKTLTSGNIWSPSCSLDGRFVFYADLVIRPQRILRISIEGGDPVEIAKVSGDGMTGTMDVSPDGRFLAYPYHASQPDTFGLIVVPVEGGAPVKTFPIIDADCVRWSPDGTGIDLNLTRDGIENIFEQPLAGGELRQLTKFTSGRFSDDSWSPDGKQMYVAHGEMSRDVVLISNFR